MNQETLKKYLKKQGFKVRFDSKTVSLSTDEMKVNVSKRFEEDVNTFEFQLTGPPPSNDIMHALIAYGEEEAKQEERDFSFYTFHFTFRHPDYYNCGTYHSKVSMLEEDGETEAAALFYLLHDACVEEEKHDAFFDWNFTESYPTVELSVVKTNEEITFDLWYDDSKYMMHVSPSSASSFSEEFFTPQECLARFKDILQETDRKNRLNTVFETSMYYTDRFLRHARFYSESVEPVFQYLQQSHTAETIEIYFKELQITHVPVIQNEVDDHYFLIRLLDTWIVNSEYEDVTFFESDRFNEALEFYEKALIRRIFNKKNLKKIEHYKTSR